MLIKSRIICLISLVLIIERIYCVECVQNLKLKMSICSKFDIFSLICCGFSQKKNQAKKNDLGTNSKNCRQGSCFKKIKTQINYFAPTLMIDQFINCKICYHTYLLWFFMKKNYAIKKKNHLGNKLEIFQTRSLLKKMFLLQNCLKRLINSYFVKNPVSHLFVVVGTKIKQEKRKPSGKQTQKILDKVVRSQALLAMLARVFPQ